MGANRSSERHAVFSAMTRQFSGIPWYVWLCLGPAGIVFSIACYTGMIGREDEEQ
jgi:hypothetical protein